MASRADEIIAAAEANLDYFYKVYGEWDGYSKKPTTKFNKRKCKHAGCMKYLTVGEYCHDHRYEKKNSTIKVKDHDLNLREVKVKKTVAPAIPLYKVTVAKPVIIPEISLEGLNAKEVIALVKEKTGVSITISVKSKQSVLRYAKKYLGEKGIKVKGG